MREPLRAISVGPLAQRALDDRLSTGAVIAVFPSTVWMRVGEAMICLTLRTIAPGPVNIVVDLDRGDWRSSGLSVGQKVTALPNSLKVGILEVALAQAASWAPDPFRADRLGQGLRLLRAVRDLPPQLDAKAWCQGHASTQWAQWLIGRGPGLTPAGDDTLGGMMIALHSLGRVAQAQELWSKIQGPAMTQTNPISYALLAAAAEGLGSAALHSALNGIGQGHPPHTYVAGIDALGHSSGWDALAGAVTVFEAERALA